MKYRLDPQPLEWLDRSRSVSFRFEGETFTGFGGDSYSSALLASGQQLLGRSFKYHRPRSVLSMANHDVNALFQSAEEPNIRGDVTPLAEGVELRACNVNGTLANDRDSYIGLLLPFPAGGFLLQGVPQATPILPLLGAVDPRKGRAGHHRYPLERPPQAQAVWFL